MNSISLNRKEVDKIVDLLNKLDMDDYISRFDIIEEEGGGIGSIIKIKVVSQEHGYTVAKTYEISGVDDW